MTDSTPLPDDEDGFDDEIEAAKEHMSIDQLAKMEAIEIANQILQEAGVPYVLWGSTRQYADGACDDWWQFHRMAYDEDEEVEMARVPAARGSLLPPVMMFLSRGYQGYLAVFSPDKTPTLVYQNGAQVESLSS